MTNKTTKICCTLALLASVATTPAFSQTKKFEGLSIGLGGTAIGNNTNLSGTAPSYEAGGAVISNTLNGNFGKTNLVPFIDASYSFPVSNNFLFGIGARYDFSNNKAGNLNSDITAPNVTIGYDDDGEDAADLASPVVTNIRNVETTTLKYKDHKSIYIMPTYIVSNSSAIFAKFGYHEQKGTLSYENVQTVGSTAAWSYEDSAYEGGDFITETISGSGSKNFKGYGYGIGFKTLLTDNLYMQLDAEMIDYDKESTTQNDYTFSAKPKSVNASISVGYKF